MIGETRESTEAICEAAHCDDQAYSDVVPASFRHVGGEA